MKVTIKTVNADGQSTVVEHPANFDGKDYPITGSTQADVIALKQIDTYTSEATLKHASQILATSRRIVSKDGKSMTVTYQGVDSRGRNVDSMAVYERRKNHLPQEPRRETPPPPTRPLPSPPPF